MTDKPVHGSMAQVQDAILPILAAAGIIDDNHHLATMAAKQKLVPNGTAP